MDNWEFLKKLRENGVKAATIMNWEGERFVTSVEFFEPPTGSAFSPLDLDTIAPARDPLTDPEETSPMPANPVPPALRRLLEKGSVS